MSKSIQTARHDEDKKRDATPHDSAPLGENHPLSTVAGTYEGATWERILKNIKRNREEQDHNELTEA